MARRRASLARMQRKRQSRRAGLGMRGWSESSLTGTYEEVKGRFNIVEEDAEGEALAIASA